MQNKKVSLIVKIVVLSFVILLVPSYFKHYGAQNFLWLSDIGLFLTLGALWFESPLMISIACTTILFFEIVWNIGFFCRLLTGQCIVTIADYMFDAHISLFLRALSLFHIAMPIIWIWCLVRWGYDKRAIFYALPLLWVTLVMTYFFTDPNQNINWVFMPHTLGWTWMPSIWWLTIIMTASSFLLAIPIHLLLSSICKRAAKNQ